MHALPSGSIVSLALLRPSATYVYRYFLYASPRRWNQLHASPFSAWLPHTFTLHSSLTQPTQILNTLSLQISDQIRRQLSRAIQFKPRIDRVKTPTKRLQTMLSRRRWELANRRNVCIWIMELIRFIHYSRFLQICIKNRKTVYTAFSLAYLLTYLASGPGLNFDKIKRAGAGLKVQRARPFNLCISH